MKKLIVLILCLTACRTADAQSVRFFATADDYLNGRFDTLPRSSLKVRRPFIAIRKTRIPKGELRHRLRAMGPNLLVVGDSVYSNLTTVGVGKPSKRFRQVQRFGDRIFFLTWTKSQYMNAMLAGYMFGIIGNTLSSGLARPYCCYWNLQTGEFGFSTALPVRSAGEISRFIRELPGRAGAEQEKNARRLFHQILGAGKTGAAEIRFLREGLGYRRHDRPNALTETPNPNEANFDRNGQPCRNESPIRLLLPEK